ICSMHDPHEFESRALSAGAMGYVHKRSLVPDLVDAIGCVLDDRLFAEVAVLGPLCGTYLADAAGAAALRDARDLDADDRRVLEMIGGGCGSREIGERLGWDADTVSASRA